MSGSGWTVDSKVSWVMLITSEGFSASESATTRDARATAEAAETNDEKRIVVLQGKEWVEESRAILHPFMGPRRAYVSISLLRDRGTNVCNSNLLAQTVPVYLIQLLQHDK